MTEDKEATMVAVPADLLTRACQLLGQLPAATVGRVYVDLLACKPTDAPQT